MAKWSSVFLVDFVAGIAKELDKPQDQGNKQAIAKPTKSDYFL